MKTYKVLDLQGANFMDWTWETPQTKQQIRAYLYNMDNDGKVSPDDMWVWNDYSLIGALEHYNLALVEAK